MAVALDSFVVPAWVAKLVCDLAASAHIDLAAIAIVAPHGEGTRRLVRVRGPRPRGSLFSIYERFDARRCRGTPDALAEVDLSAELPAVTVLGLVAARADQSSRDASAAALRTLRGLGLDVIVDLRRVAVPEQVCDCARHGAWFYRHGADGSDVGALAFFWEAHDRDAVCSTTLRMVCPETHERRTLYRSCSAIDESSLCRSRNAAYWKSAEFVARRLADLHRSGWHYLESLATNDDIEPVSATLRSTPTNAEMVRFLARGIVTTIKRKVIKSLYREVWCVAYRRAAPADDAIARFGPAAGGPPFRFLDSPPDRYYADPFVVEDEDSAYCLFEDYDIGTGRGVISVSQFDADGRLGPATTILQCDYHLSYPFVFSHDGSWYMIPESGAGGTIQLFRATDFPYRWVPDRVLVEGVNAADPTIVEHGGRVWLFASVAVPGASIADELFLFYADSVFSEWTPHPMNPIVSDVRRARPAGRVTVRNGSLIRPGQDSSHGYGWATVLNRIITLTPTEYEELPIARIEADWLRGNVGTHTYNIGAGYEVVDAKRRVLKRSLPRRSPRA